MSRRAIYVLSAVLGVLLLATAFVGGFTAAQVVDVHGLLGIETPESDLGEKVEEVERMLDRQALEPSSEESKTAGALSGLLEGLGDPYAVYFDPEHFEYFNEQSDGEFYGIGVTIAEREGSVYIVEVIDDTPASRSGLQADDEFVVIDGVERDEWTVDEVVRRVRGPEGTLVNVTMRRPAPEDGEDAEPELIDFEIERAKVEIPNVMSRLEGDVGYIRLLSFNQLSADDLREEIGTLESEGAASFVLDVRDNPGGLLDSAIDVASLFIEDGVIVRVEERDRPQVEHRASGRLATDAPLVLLVNENSASASEVLAGALQDYGRATLVGTQTFGKGSVQTVERLSFGGGIKFTIAHYLTPQERAIDGVGLTPDVVVEMEPQMQDDEADDVQLQRALELARSAQ